MLEIMIAVLIIALLCLMAMPFFRKARRRTNITETANDLKVFGDAFQMYAMERGGFPDDSHLEAPYHLPNELMEQYLKPEKWAEPTPLGGNYNWEGPDSYDYAGIAIFDPAADEAMFRELDEIFDNGNLLSGLFRKTPNGRYTYILEE
jgi:type IV pilus assembly protein PilA